MEETQVSDELESPQVSDELESPQVSDESECEQVFGMEENEQVFEGEEEEEEEVFEEENVFGPLPKIHDQVWNYWKGEDEWYHGEIVAIRTIGTDIQYETRYDDGDVTFDRLDSELIRLDDPALVRLYALFPFPEGRFIKKRQKYSNRILEAVKLLRQRNSSLEKKGKFVSYLGQLQKAIEYMGNWDKGR
eukprot:TRINITY_DN5328_c0_g1_i1.p1 TRINITY_DN5328_c0_g1~~TRINITY_DN5328_c0_g1_i1.p1  ORF type:complete len:209 (-),score=55.42 TRINITY_DN5328_c0_g1_i1:677-1246(-)